MKNKISYPIKKIQTFGKCTSKSLVCDIVRGGLFSCILIFTIPLHKKMKFSIKDFFSLCDHIRRKSADLASFTEEILNGKLHFLSGVLSDS